MKCSCILFWVKMSEYSQIIYCLQEKIAHFGLEVSVVYVILSLYVLNFFKKFSNIYFDTKYVKKWGKKNVEPEQAFMCLIVLNILEQNISKDQTRKLYQVFVYSFLCQND